ncbi:hypothetical protein [Haloarchaeobius amylolyticus]|nr:hypothetical protein [Haloarchaeobius amylolyticus]
MQPTDSTSVRERLLHRWRAIDRGWKAITVGIVVTLLVEVGVTVPW